MAWKNTRGLPTLQRELIEIDATGKVVGRLASEIARLLMGKHRPGYVPHIDAGAAIKVRNIRQLSFTGRKLEQKVLIRSSNRPGGIKRTPVSKLMFEDPARVLQHAVQYMLPKNRHQNARLKRLLID